MASEGEILQVGEAQETPQAITITIVDPSALGAASLDSSLVDAQDGSDSNNIVMVAEDGHGSKDILQTVTETHMGTEELPIISNICNPEEEEEEVEDEEEEEEEDDETIFHKSRLSESFDGVGEEAELEESYEEAIGPHCLVCNIDLPPSESEADEQILVFKTQTSTTQRRVAIFLSSLIGQKLTSRKAHSDIVCRRCFGLLDRVDSLEVEIRETKEEIVNKYQDTVSIYGGRARRRKPATATKPDYVFPKVEPEDEDDQLLDMELDGNFEPQVEDLMGEDPSINDDDWEPEFKRARIKKESPDITDTGGPPKRKRGRPRKDASRPKGAAVSTPPWPRICVTTTEPPDLHDNQNSLEAEEEKGSCHVASATRRPSLTATSTRETLDGRPSPPPLSQQCPICFITYFTISDLRNHFKQIHTDVKFVKCIQCNEQIYGNFDIFLAHRKRLQCWGGAVTGRDPKTRECHVCHKQVRASGHSHHLATHKSVSCPTCNIQVAKRNLKRHINYHHTKEVLYPCDDCPSVYLDASNLLSHRKRNHMGQEVRRHLCEVCGKKFITPSDLRTHVAAVHQNLKKFVCEFCGLSFKISSALMYHRRLHTGERPHTCHVCERSFMKPNGLAKHVRLVHGLEYQGKYRKRTKAPEPSSKGASSQVPSNSVAPKREGMLGPPIPEVERDCHSSMPPTLKEAARQDAEDEGLRVSAVYSVEEGGVVQVVNLHGPQPIQNLTYFRPATEDRAVARPFEAAAPLHTISYYRQDAEEQYTVVELLPPQNPQEPSHTYPGSASSPEPAQPH